MSITFNVPINSVSLGQTSIAILREAYKANLDCCIFPIGPVDLSAQNPDPKFDQWLHQKIKESPKHHKRTNRAIKLWHISDINQSYGAEPECVTFLETDACSAHEVAALNNQKVTWVTSNYTKEVMEDYGVKNVKYLELGLDTHSFYKTDRKYYASDVTVIGFGGKFETSRKKHIEIIRALAQKYGNNPKIMIHAAVFNPFFSGEDNSKMIQHALEGKKYFNFVFLPFMQKNAEYNDFLNSCDVFLGMSGGEGRDLPVYQAAALGKKIVALNAHAYKDYLNHDNAWLVEPNGKCSCVDNVFFHANSDYNTGNFFTWDKDEFLAKLEECIKSPPQQQFKFVTYKETFDQLLNG